MRNKPLKLHLLFDYCPICFRPSDKPNCFHEIHESDDRLEKMQAFYARNKRNGLRLLDLQMPGAPCGRSTCNLLCLVCAKPTFYSGDPFIESFVKSGFSKKDNAGVCFTPFWKNPIHKRCARRSVNCRCWLPLDFEDCPLHPPQVKKELESLWSRMMEGSSSDEMPESAAKTTGWEEIMRKMKPAKPPPLFKKPKSKTPSPVEKKPEPAKVTAGSAWAGLMTKMRSDAPKCKPKPKPAPSLAETERDKWMAKQVVPCKTGNFDPRVHGYWMTKQGLVYRFPDGREAPATGVDDFDV